MSNHQVCANPQTRIRVTRVFSAPEIGRRRGDRTARGANQCARDRVRRHANGDAGQTGAHLSGDGAMVAMVAMGRWGDGDMGWEREERLNVRVRLWRVKGGEREKYGRASG